MTGIRWGGSDRTLGCYFSCRTVILCPAPPAGFWDSLGVISVVGEPGRHLHALFPSSPSSVLRKGLWGGLGMWDDSQAALDLDTSTVPCSPAVLWWELRVQPVRCSLC